MLKTWYKTVDGLPGGMSAVQLPCDREKGRTGRTPCRHAQWLDTAHSVDVAGQPQQQRHGQQTTTTIASMTTCNNLQGRQQISSTQPILTSCLRYLV